MTKVPRSALVRRWLHSHEEDTETETVFRPDTFDFPPSRGRRGLELREDGVLVETAIGPTDALGEVVGEWELQSDDALVIRLPTQRGRDRTMRIMTAEPDRLVLGK